MFEGLSHPKILVTGPHRSGTTIAARMIAADTGLPLTLEEGVKSRAHLVTLTGVIQCPISAYCAHEIGCFVVFMIRSVADILRSQQRWYFPDGKRLRWNGMDRLVRSLYHAKGNEPTPAIQYRAWEWQKTQCESLSLDYGSLREHPLWRENRSLYHGRQTEPGEEVIPLPPDDGAIEIGLARV